MDSGCILEKINADYYVAASGHSIQDSSGRPFCSIRFTYEQVELVKKYVLEFVRRGLIACGFGPSVLVILYLVLQHHAALETLTVQEVCLGIVSLSALAFIAGGMNVIYQMMVAILIHGGVLYLGYLGTYLLNGWLEWGQTPILVFSGIFAVGYLVIWAIIYAVLRRNTATLNEQLRQKQKRVERE